MRKKGAITAIEFCLTILLRIKKLSGEISLESGTLIIDEKENKIEVRLPSQLASAGVVEDLFDYLLPAGMTYRITEYEQSEPGAKTDLIFTQDYDIDSNVQDEELMLYDSPDTSEYTNKGGTIYKNLVVNPYKTNEGD